MKTVVIMRRLKHLAAPFPQKIIAQRDNQAVKNMEISNN